MSKTLRNIALAGAAALALTLAPATPLQQAPSAEALARGACSPWGWTHLRATGTRSGQNVTLTGIERHRRFGSDTHTRVRVNGRTYNHVSNITVNPPGTVSNGTVVYVTFVQTLAKDVSCRFTLVGR